MRIGVFARLDENSAPVDELARALEDRDIESLWVGEHTHAPVATEPDGYHDATMVENAKTVPAPLVLLTVAAAVTKRLRVGTSICIVAQHAALAFAKEVATLDMVSGGRFELGCGYGWNRAELVNHGIDPRRRRAAFRETLTAMEMLWDQDVAGFEGEFVSFTPSWSWPKPTQRPRPPVLIGAPGRPEVFRDIVELADGWMPSAHFTDAELAEQMGRLHEAARAAGRPPESLAVTLLESRPAAMGSLTPPEFTERCPTLDRLREWENLGVHRVVVGVPVDDRDAMLPMLDHLAGLVRQMDR